MLVQRSTESATLEEPTRLMEWWQQVVELEDDLAGYNEVAPRTAAELINVDIQNSAGSAHSGYVSIIRFYWWINSKLHANLFL